MQNLHLLSSVRRVPILGFRRRTTQFAAKLFTLDNLRPLIRKVRSLHQSQIEINAFIFARLHNISQTTTSLSIYSDFIGSILTSRHAIFPAHIFVSKKGKCCYHSYSHFSCFMFHVAIISPLIFPCSSLTPRTSQLSLWHRKFG